jgi:hypothetical protein
MRRLCLRVPNPEQPGYPCTEDAGHEGDHSWDSALWDAWIRSLARLPARDVERHDLTTEPTETEERHG